MLLLTELLTPPRIRVPLAAADKPGALRELAAFLVEQSGGDLADIMRAVDEREEVLSTGIGFGVAIPHGRSPTISDLAVVAGVTRVPIAYDALDGAPVRVLFLLVGPESAAGRHVKVLSRIARLVRREALRERLLQAKTRAEFHEALVEAEAR